jgi:signal transduction histidine kinase
MRLSIRLTMLLAMNLLVVALTVAVGYQAGEVAGDVVEQRLAREVADNTAGFLERRQPPLTDTTLGYLSEMFNVQFAAIESGSESVAATSLTGEQARQLQARLSAPAGGSGSVSLSGTQYQWQARQVTLRDIRREAPRPVTLVALVPASQFQQVRASAKSRVARSILPAAVGASVLAIAVSLLITRPVRRLANEMDTLARDPRTGATSGRAGGSRKRRRRRGPSEVARLGRSFDRLLDRLEHARRRLARSERLATLGRVSAAVAHELRNPLSGIKMHLRLLQDDLPAGQADPRDVDTLLRETERMDLYLRELMSLAAGEQDPAGGRAARPMTGDELARCVESVLDLLAGRLDHAGVRADFHRAGDVRTCLADPVGLRQVLMNLLVNAIEAMPEGGTVTVRTTGLPRGGAAVEVIDTGVGIDESREVFEPFVSTKAGSAGLGLYICRRIVRAAGGEIGYESTPEATRFAVHLAAADQAHETPASRDETSPDPSAGGDEPSPGRPDGDGENTPSPDREDSTRNPQTRRGDPNA